MRMLLPKSIYNWLNFCSSADSGIGNQPLKRRTLIRTNDAHMEEVMIMIGLLSANNWQQRYEGISNFLSMCETNPMLVSTHIIKVSVAGAVSFCMFITGP